jgi:hypothetical protein
LDAARQPSTASASHGRWRSISRRTSAGRPKTLFATHYHELTGSRGRSARDYQRARRGAGVAGGHRLSAQDRARTIGPQLWDSGRPSRRHARTRHQTGAGDSRSARARRTDARRPAVYQRHAVGTAATAGLFQMHRRILQPRSLCSACAMPTRTT